MQLKFWVWASVSCKLMHRIKTNFKIQFQNLCTCILQLPGPSATLRLHFTPPCTTIYFETCKQSLPPISTKLLWFLWILWPKQGYFKFNWHCDAVDFSEFIPLSVFMCENCFVLSSLVRQKCGLTLYTLIFLKNILKTRFKSRLHYLKPWAFSWSAAKCRP